MGIIGRWVRASGPHGNYHLVTFAADRAGRFETLCARRVRPHPTATVLLLLPHHWRERRIRLPVEPPSMICGCCEERHRKGNSNGL